MTTITTKSLAGKDLTINYGWVTEEKKVWLDGDTVTMPEDRFVLEVEVEGLGKVEMPQLEAKATDRARELRVNYNDTNVIVGQVVYKGKRHRVIVKIDDETYETIKAAMDRSPDQAALETETVGEAPETETNEIAAAYGLTAKEYRREWQEFVMSEGYHGDGHESKTFGDWLTYRSKAPRLATNDPQE